MIQSSLIIFFASISSLQSFNDLNQPININSVKKLAQRQIAHSEDTYETHLKNAVISFWLQPLKNCCIFKICHKSTKKLWCRMFISQLYTFHILYLSMNESFGIYMGVHIDEYKAVLCSCTLSRAEVFWYYPIEMWARTNRRAIHKINIKAGIE